MKIITLTTDWSLAVQNEVPEYKISTIFDEDGNEIYKGFREISKEEAELFKTGYLKGMKIGEQVGENRIKIKFNQLMKVES